MRRRWSKKKKKNNETSEFLYQQQNYILHKQYGTFTDMNIIFKAKKNKNMKTKPIHLYEQ